MELKDICQYVSERVATATLTIDSYISTENMLPDKGGVVVASGVPAGNAVAFAKGDVLVSNIRPYFKKIWRADKKGGCSADVLCFRPNEKVDSKYFYYLLSQQSFFDYIMSGSKGCKMPRGDKKQIMQWLFDLHSFEEQKRIAGILSSIDDKIVLNRRINDNLEQQAQALFKSWFVDFEPFKDGEFEETEQGTIPKGWRMGYLSELGDIVGGSTPSKAKPEYYTDNGIAWLTSKDLSVSQRKFTSKGETDITQEGYNSCSTKLMPKGTVLFSSRAPIGYITIAKNNICTNQGFKSVIPMLAGTAFIYCFLKEATQEIENKATGSTFKEASGTLMKSLSTIIPERAVLDEFENLMSPIFKQQEVVEEENCRRASLRDTLLPKLISGELKISSLNN